MRHVSPQEMNLIARVTAYATQLSTCAHVTQAGRPMLVTSLIALASTAVAMGCAMPPSTPHAAQIASLDGWARDVTSHVSMVHRAHQTVASVNVTHALQAKGVTVNVLYMGDVTVCHASVMSDSVVTNVSLVAVQARSTTVLCMGPATASHMTAFVCQVSM